MKWNGGVGDDATKNKKELSRIEFGSRDLDCTRGGTTTQRGRTRTRSDAKKLGNGLLRTRCFTQAAGTSARFRGDSGRGARTPANQKPVRSFAWHWDRANENGARVVCPEGAVSSDRCAMGDGRSGTTRLGRRRFQTNFCAKRHMAGPFAHMLHLVSNWPARRVACATDRNLAPREIYALLLPPTALPVRANIAHAPVRMTVPSKSNVPPSHLHRPAAA